MTLKTQFSAAAFFLLLLAVLFPFAADLHLPLLHGEVVEWIENGQALWLLFGAVFTASYIKPLSLEKGSRQFWLWAVVWWVVLLGRSTSWGRDYFPHEPKLVFRTISVILIAALALPILLSSTLRKEIALKLRTAEISLWMALVVVITFLISDSVEHHRLLAPWFLHARQYQDLIEELYEIPFMVGLFFITWDLMKNEKRGAPLSVAHASR
ncbi:hypothetical protein CHU32_03180 [Superficieibacter electus]|uniref:Nitric oxide reductase n=1 Tax=Superficieibacter electus TaxID=2022662 RepID=A0A2P5GV58_9ENTR|nr:hypothetical protein [Superficieibacter electus]POP44424.1 hypothetical protein CHU33_13290 [Superficieibacter electus]POP50442.1 hypothetical protein CHU32_03180 [Superficieibacter electus]